MVQRPKTQTTSPLDPSEFRYPFRIVPFLRKKSLPKTPLRFYPKIPPSKNPTDFCLTKTAPNYFNQNRTALHR
jgi:hypothetical protein